MKVVIKNWHQITSWSWNVPQDEVCGICRVSFDGTCPSCKFPGDDCPLIIGECHHNFHVHCILKWLQTENSRGLCPMCRQVFKLADDPSNPEVELPEIVSHEELEEDDELGLFQDG